MPYNAQLFALQEWLRQRLRRDSMAWNALYSLKQFGLRLEEKLREPGWRAADREFIALLSDLDRRVPDFYFVQVGAHDGSMDDPLTPWIAAGRWRGLFIEPQPEQFARLRSRYADQKSRFAFENVAIDRVVGERDLFRVADDHLHVPEMSGLASLLPDRALATHAALGRTTRITVRCEPLQSVVQRHEIRRIDLLQIDTEGYDAVVLETLDLTTTRPSLIHYEHRHLSRREQAACSRRLRAHGYEVKLKRHDAFAFLPRSLRSASSGSASV